MENNSIDYYIKNIIKNIIKNYIKNDAILLKKLKIIFICISIFLIYFYILIKQTSYKRLCQKYFNK